MATVRRPVPAAVRGKKWTTATRIFSLAEQRWGIPMFVPDRRVAAPAATEAAERHRLSMLPPA